MTTAFPFCPEERAPELEAILVEVARTEVLDQRSLRAILRRYPTSDGLYSKSELVRGVHLLEARGVLARRGVDAARLLERLRRKPIRTQSGVAPVTVLTRPHPCPGRCVFCPSDVRMPKSYLSDEPGAQRAAEHQFDPFRQTLSRLLALHQIGHLVDKVELIVLGGTWTSYPESYRRWFIKRCFDALEAFADGRRTLEPLAPRLDFSAVVRRVDGERNPRDYNRAITEHVARIDAGGRARAREATSWWAVEKAHRRNEGSAVRCVGLSVETRPELVDEAELRCIRRLGATKVQLGLQSLDDAVLARNRRGHDVATSRRAAGLLRRAGFKFQAHWMPNLLGATPEGDIADFRRLFTDPALCPDELKVYPCSLIESAELMLHYRDGSWRPYSHQELLDVLTACMVATPPYCRVTRVIRDIPGTDIVAGNLLTNFRQVVDRELERRGVRSRDIRAREVRGRRLVESSLRDETLTYPVASGEECFLQVVGPQDELAGFLRLFLPREPSFLPELGGAALLREVHVYGAVEPLGGRRASRATQHRGLGRRLIERAALRAAARGYRRLAVISAIGTKTYYRKLGFVDGELYQHLPLV